MPVQCGATSTNTGRIDNENQNPGYKASIALCLNDNWSLLADHSRHFIITALNKHNQIKQKGV
jgi:hypothetical protein